MNNFNMFLTQVILTANRPALFDEDYTIGQAGAVEWLRVNAGNLVCWVISAVGFIIVAAAIIKNALAGLYLAYPKLWDKVHAVREQIEGGGSTGGSGSGGGEKVKKIAGSIMMILISALPDVKDATDFADEEGSNNNNIGFTRRQWLIKSIPSFLGLVMVGMLIFYGYPTKLANWVGDTGRYALDAFFDNVDPVQFTKKVFDGLATYELATDSATSSFERNVNDITRSALKQMYTKYSDMQAQPLQQTATNIEADILADFTNATELAVMLEEPDGMTISYAVQLTSTVPNIREGVFTEVTDVRGALVGKMFSATSTAGVKQFKWYIKASEYPTGSTKVGDLDHILVTVNATPRSQSIVTSSKATYVVGTSYSVDTSKSIMEIPEVKFNTAGTSCIYVTDGSAVTVQVYDATGKKVDHSCTGNIHLEGMTGYITFTNSTANTLATKISGAGYVEIILDNKAYTLYETTSGGAAVTSKVTVYGIRLQSDKTGWANTAATDYRGVDTAVTDSISASFFEVGE